MVLLLVHGRIPAARGCFELTHLRDARVDALNREKKDEARNILLNESKRGNNECFVVLVRLQCVDYRRCRS